MDKSKKDQIQEKINSPIAAGTLDLMGALENSSIFCFRYYPKLKLMVVPENTRRAWNCEPYYENVPDSLCEVFVAPVYHEPFRKLYRSIDEGAPTASLVFGIKDQKTWSRVTITTTKWDSEHQPEECIAVTENLSSTLNMEKEIEERNKELSMAMQVFQIATEATGNIVFLFDAKRQSILVADNTANHWGIMTEQMGVPYETAVNGIVPEASRAEYIRVHEEIMHGAQFANGRVQLCDAAGNVGYYELAFRAILDEGGNPTGKAVGVYKNVTQNVQYDKKLSFIIESLVNTYSSVYYVDIKTAEYERITEREISVLGIPETGKWSEGFGGYLKNFVDSNYHEEFGVMLEVQKFGERVGDNESIAIEYQRCDKRWRKAFMFPAAHDENGAVTSVIYAVQRIDAEKKREQETKQALREAYDAAQLASNAKTSFLTNISHDIRTPMNAIIGMTAIAAANIDNQEKVTDSLKKITASSKHLLGLINEVLDMSKIESGRVDLNETNFILSDMIDELIYIHQSLISDKGHSLSVEIRNVEHEKVIGDSIRLQQVLTNLLSNAIKYTPEGGKIELTITEKKTNKPAIGCYEIEIRDNGIGMSEEYQAQIFEPFSRAKDERISAIQGTGLGMPIARNIIRMMNGDITVKSKVNEGSTFTVSFVLRLQQEDREDYQNLVGLPVLVVDDDVAACENTCAVLDSLSMQSEYVTSGRLAVEKTVEHHNNEDDYYAVIVDWKMPDMDGVETTREIRKKVGGDIPIIVLTAYDWTDIEQEARAAGVSAFLKKPLFKTRVVDLFLGFIGKRDKVPEPKQSDYIHRHDFSGKRILLAEDNELNREIAVEILSMNGLEMETAENGKLCLEKFTESEKGYYDLILMDIQMPVMDGYAATRAIRASDHPDAETIPIVAMTANAFSTDVRDAFDAGMNGHISKPIDISNVFNVLVEQLYL